MENHIGFKRMISITYGIQKRDIGVLAVYKILLVLVVEQFLPEMMQQNHNWPPLGNIGTRRLPSGFNQNVLKLGLLNVKLRRKLHYQLKIVNSLSYLTEKHSIIALIIRNLMVDYGVPHKCQIVASFCQSLKMGIGVIVT